MAENPTNDRVYGHTKSGEPITDETIEQFSDEAERGYDAGELTGRPRGHGRPPIVDDSPDSRITQYHPSHFLDPLIDGSFLVLGSTDPLEADPHSESALGGYVREANRIERQARAVITPPSE